MKPATDALLAALAALAVAGAACSGGSETSGETKPQDEASSRPADAGAPAPGRSAAELATAEFRVEGMTCGGCAVATEMAVEKLDGVESADAEYLGGEEAGRCTVTFDPAVVTADRIAAAIEGAGYEPTLARTTSGS